KLAGFEVGIDRPLFLIAGPCVIESAALVEEVAGWRGGMARERLAPFMFQACLVNRARSSVTGVLARGGPGGRQVVSDVRKNVNVPVLTDVHEDTPFNEVASVVDVLQTPAFLCRQTNFIRAVASAGKPVNIKKGQFLSPWEMQQVVDKARATG